MSSDIKRVTKVEMKVIKTLFFFNVGETFWVRSANIYGILISNPGNTLHLGWTREVILNFGTLYQNSKWANFGSKIGVRPSPHSGCHLSQLPHPASEGPGQTLPGSST